MMKQENTVSMISDMFPYMPMKSDVSDKSFQSSENTKSKMPAFKAGGSQHRNLSPTHIQQKTFPPLVEKLTLPRLDHTIPRRRYAGGSMIRQMDGLTARLEEEIPVNPEPAPWKSQDFLSSTVMKNMHISRRHLDTFPTLDNLYSGKRGQALHTQRYSWDTSRSLDSMSQRDRLIAEIESLERLRDIKRKTEILPHRIPLDMCMGGKRLDIEERFDINREIRRLKAMVLPQYAKDLYHGRGIKLHSNHASIKPRKAPIPDDDCDIVTNSAPASLRRNRSMFPNSSDTSRLNTQRSLLVSLPHRREKLPKINNHSNFVGKTEAVLLSQEKRRAEQIRARLHQKSFDLDASLSRSNTNVLPSLHRNPASWVQDQNQHIIETSQREDSRDEDIVRIPEVERSSTDLGTPGAPTTTPGAPPPTAGAPTVTPGAPTTPPGTQARTPVPSSFSRQSLSPAKPITPYPLKGSELTSNVPDNEKAALKETFRKLDTDSDGHLKFSQLRSELPPEFSPQQEEFLKQVYDITSSSTYFGVDEFLTMSQLGQNIKDLSEKAVEAYNLLQDLDLRQFIIRYVDLFQTVDRNHSGKISLNSLQQILSAGTDIDLDTNTNVWSQIISVLNMKNANEITKIEYLAHLPYFHQLNNSNP